MIDRALSGIDDAGPVMKLTDAQMDEYTERGFLAIPGVLSADEIEILRAERGTVQSPRRGHPDGNVYEKNTDAIRVSYGADLDSDLIATTARLPRLLGPARQMLGPDVYLLQARINSKTARGGEYYQWHTDYAHWVNNGIPKGTVNDIMSILVMLTPSTSENGCLQVIPGSHRHGAGKMEFDTGSTSYQTFRATDIYIAELLAESPPVDIVGEPGTIVLFAPAIMHGSQENWSTDERHYLFYVYNRTDNQPVEGKRTREHQTPYINSPFTGILEAVPDDAIVARAA